MVKINENIIINIWAVSNKIAVVLQSIYIFTRIIRLPYLKNIPHRLNILPLIVSYGCICLYKFNKNMPIRQDINLYALIFFCTFPNTLFVLPFGLNALISVAKNDLTKLREKKIKIEDLEFNQKQADFYIFLLENKPKLSKILINIEIIGAIVMPFAMILSFASLQNVISYYNLLRYEYQRSDEFKAISQRYVSLADNILRNESPLKTIYERIRDSFLAILDRETIEELTENTKND